jgi:hypothetical protein
MKRILMIMAVAALALSLGAGPVEDFEFATDDTAAAAGVTVSPETSVTIGVGSGSGADANEGTYSLRIDFSTPGTAGGFEGGYVQRDFSPPIDLARTYAPAGAPGNSIEDLVFTLDIKGAPGFAAGSGTNLWMFVHNGEGDRFRYINFTDPVLNSTTFTDDHRIGLGLIDLDAGGTGSGTLSQISAVELYIQNPNASTAITGSLFVDDLQLREPGGLWGPGITIDGNFDDWDGQVPTVVADPTGDATAGRDIVNVYVANDADNLYVRLQYSDSDFYDGDEFTGIDGDANFGTGFNLFGAGLGSDTLIAGASAFGETTGSFNSGTATPATLEWSPFASTQDVEYAVPLSMTIPGDISQSFPGGLGSTIRLMYGDGAVGSDDVTTAGLYVLATEPTLLPFTSVIDDMALYDTDAHALFRTQDISSGGSSAVASNRAAGGPAGVGDTALAVLHTNPSGTAFIRSLIQHSFAEPISIVGHEDITIDVYGDVSLTDQNLVVGLRDLDGDSFAVGTATPATAEWTTFSLGPTSVWFDQNPGTLGDDVFDDAHVVGWWVGIEESTDTSSTSATLGYDKLTAVITTTSVRREMWSLYH